MKQNIKKGRYLFYEGEVYDLGGGGDSGEAMAKAEEAFAAAQTAQTTANSKCEIHDNAITTLTTWSSQKIRDEIDSATPSGLVSYAESQTLTDAQKTQARENIGADWVLLWQNASASNDFAPQNITVNNLSDYEIVVIAFKTYKADAAVTINMVPYDAGGTRDYPVFAPFIIQRVVTWSGNVVTFGDAWQFKRYNNYTTTTDNGYLVPYQIYGAN